MVYLLTLLVILLALGFLACQGMAEFIEWAIEKIEKRIKKEKEETVQ